MLITMLVWVGVHFLPLYFYSSITRTWYVEPNGYETESLDWQIMSLFTFLDERRFVPDTHLILLSVLNYTLSVLYTGIVMYFIFTVWRKTKNLSKRGG